jgi:hypothetical protein
MGQLFYQQLGVINAILEYPVPGSVRQTGGRFIVSANNPPGLPQRHLQTI